MRHTIQLPEEVYAARHGQTPADAIQAWARWAAGTGSGHALGICNL